jgi:transcriptional regulator with XRE-family HTH domain
MDRKEFGQLVAVLRQDLGWTQFQLSEFADVDEAVISQLERGVKKCFEPELLFRLMNALQLTTLERREFILAASGLDESHIVRQPSAIVKTETFDAPKTVERMADLVGEIRLPAFLSDDYGDVIAANRIILTFYRVPASMLENAANIPGGFNTTRLNFGRDLIGRNHVLDNWDGYAVKVMRTFRENSFRCRVKPYFRYLMKAFRNPAEYPLFDRYWKLAASTEADKELNLDYFSYQHAEYGELKYISSETVSTTSFGRLHLIQSIPLNENTGRVFDELLKSAGTGAMRLAPWPEKPLF